MEVHPALEQKSLQEVIQNHNFLVEELDRSKKYIQDLEKTLSALKDTVIRMVKEQEDLKNWLGDECTNLKEHCLKNQSFSPEDLTEKIAKTFFGTVKAVYSKEPNLYLTKRIKYLEKANTNLKSTLLGLNTELIELKNWVLSEIGNIRKEFQKDVPPLELNTNFQQANLQADSSTCTTGEKKTSICQKEELIALRVQVNKILAQLKKEAREYNWISKLNPQSK
jgi:hypothetical protein